ncbi:MAG: VWA domain-containing protein [Blastocatellia bacterium]|nr:VWA domain-containing protein [Blastocatellia bacterium]
MLHVDKLIKLLVVVLILSTPVFASDVKTHIILLDASGSMKKAYLSGLRDWLIQPMLDSGVIGSGERVIVRTFDKRGNTAFQKEDPQRKFIGNFDKAAILSAIPTSETSLGAFTSIPEALELALTDIEGLNISGNVFIWLITDNVQDVSGSGDDPISPFYEKIYSDPNFKNIYFFPIVREGETDALVMYALNYSKTEAFTSVATLMDRIGRSINQRPVLFRPIRLSSLELDRANITFEGEDGQSQLAELEDGKIVVNVSAGQQVLGKIKFKLKSKFREWKIESADVSNAKVVISGSQVLDLQEGETFQWKLDPKTLEVGPQETTKRVYAIDLSSGKTITATVPSFLDTFFLEPEINVPATISFEVENPRMRLAFFDDAELADKIRRIKGLEEIEQFLMPRQLASSTRNLALEIPILIKVKEPAKPIWILVLLGAVGMIGIVSLTVMLGSQTVFRLNGPDGESIIKLRLFSNTPIFVSSEQVGMIKRQLGGLKAKTFEPYHLENGAKETPLTDPTSFRVTNSETDRSWNFSIEKVSKQDSEDSPDFMIF